MRNAGDSDGGEDQDTQTEAPKTGVEDLAPGESLQRIVQYDLKEEGSHVLAVTVTYTEVIGEAFEEGISGGGDGGLRAQVPAGERVRTFRKLYQFLAQQCMTVRTKASELPPKRVLVEGGGKKMVLRFTLEAQLENLGEGPILLEVCINDMALCIGCISLFLGN
jgi:hypothetical protein